MDLTEVVKESYSVAEVGRKIGYKYFNGKINQEIRTLIGDLDCSHFKQNGDSQRRYEHIEKDCPVCGNKFTTKKGHKKEKVTCSYACANTFFRSGPDHGNWNEDFYRTTCFHYHDKKCVICGEDKIVEVHHLDENKLNNDYFNLIPLCPTHHQYWHSNYKSEIEEEVIKYAEEFKRNGE